MSLTGQALPLKALQLIACNDSSIITISCMFTYVHAKLQLFVAIIISHALLMFRNCELFSFNQSGFVILQIWEMLHNG